ncbi:MAG TPA: hypothetical protein VGN12_06625 [Pirellulales bacterium]|jgi:hypothetical protein
MVNQAFVFTANTNMTTLSFSSLDDNPDSITAFGPALDNVRVNAIPETSSMVIWSLLGGTWHFCRSVSTFAHQLMKV